MKVPSSVSPSFQNKRISKFNPRISVQSITGRRAFVSNIRNAFRVIAPYALFSVKKEQVEESKSTPFKYYSERKPQLLLEDLSEFLNNTVHLHPILFDTIDMLKEITKASGANLYLVDETGKAIYHHTRTEANDRNKIGWSIQKGASIAAYVAHSLEYVFVKSLRQIGVDARFPDGISYNLLANSVICCPIVTSDNVCYGVVELSRQINEPPFTERDSELTIMVTTWMSVGIHENLNRIQIEKQTMLSHYLLGLTECYFADPSLLKVTISEIVNFARLTLFAKSASFFIFNESVTKENTIVSDEYHDYEDTEHFTNGSSKRNSVVQWKVLLNKPRGIPEYVARTGKTLNLKDAANDPRFREEHKPGHIARSVLCMPLTQDNKIMGVVEVRNKKNDGYFSIYDEVLFKTFSVHCALALYFTQYHKQMHNNKIFTLNYRKLCTHQVRPCIHGIDALLEKPFVEMPLKFNTFDWVVPSFLKGHVPKYILYMFIKILGSYSIDIHATLRFILAVRKLHRDNSSHNVEFGFICLHFVYLVLLRNLERFTAREKTSMLIASFCLFIANPGNTNTFLKVINDDEALLYDSSFQENYLFLATTQILDNFQIFRNITPKEYENIRLEIKRRMLATDATNRVKLVIKLSNLINKSKYRRTNPIHHAFLKDLILATSLYSCVWKDFPKMKSMLPALFDKLNEKDNLCRNMGKSSTRLYDKEDVDLVKREQLKFFEVLVIPSLKVLKSLLPNTAECYNNLKSSLIKWDILDNEYNEKIFLIMESLPPKS